MIVCTCDTDYMHQLYFLYMLKYPVIYLLSERERGEGESGSKHARNCVYLSKMKIVPSYHQEFISHPMPEHIEGLSSLVTE